MAVYDQLRAATKKSLLQKSYKPWSFAIEMLLPVIFILGTVILWSSSSDFPFAAQSFFTDNATETNYEVKDLYANMSVFLCVNVSTNAELTAHPAGKALSRCDSLGQAFACNLPRDPSGIADAVELKNLCIVGSADPRTAAASSLKFLRLFTRNTAAPQFIPKLDDVLLVQYLAHRFVPYDLRQKDFNNIFAALARSGKIYFAPANARTTAIINYMNQSSGLFNTFYGGTFATEQEGLDFSKLVKNADNFLAMIVTTKWDATDYEVAFRFNRTSIPLTSQIRRRFDVDGLGRNPLKFFTVSGFLTIQQLTYEAYASNIHGLDISAATQPNADGLSTVMSPMPFPSYVNNDFLKLAGSIAPLLIVLGYLYPVSQLTRSIVEEKELRVREAMMIMGLSTGAFYGSWILIYTVMHTIIALVISVICKGTILANTDYGVILFLFLFFGWSTIMLSLLMSSFFSAARTAALIAPICFFVLSIPAFALSDDAPAETLAGLGFLSPTAFSLGLRLLFNYENISGLKSKDFASSTDDINMATTFALLIIDIVLYLLIGLYFDAVLPSEWGTRSHWLLCLEKPFKKLCCFCCNKSDEEKEKEELEEEKDLRKNSDGIADARLPGGFFEDQSETALQDEKEHPSAVKLLGLRKDFTVADGSNLRAVRDLTFNMKQEQVFCLLGHNAAGKTTTMNMLTGMIPITKGDATIFGLSVRDQLHEVRDMTGYCPQHNILWPELTCMEHLRFYAALKGKTDDEAEEAAQEMVRDCDLWEKRDSAAGTLSGGQKRKLSVGIAFIGDSKFVLLDEPTAGMDAGARRYIWDLIRSLSKGRVTVLSTHFMDEADILGDTIAIMSHGRLYCLGSRTFLKSNLGVGYTLTMALKGDEVKHSDRQALVKIVKDHIDCAFLQDSPPGELIIKLPTQDTSKFPDMLRAVEKQSSNHGSTGFGINATTLEEVFVKIDDRHLAEEQTKCNKEREPDNNGAEQPTASVVPMSSSNNNNTNNSDEHNNNNNNNNNDDDEKPHQALFLPEERARIEVSFWDQVSVLIMKRYNYAKRDTRTLVLQLLVPIIALLFAMALASIEFPEQPTIVLGPETYGGSITDGAECFGTQSVEQFATYVQPQARFVTPMVDNFANTTVGLQSYLLATHKSSDNDRLAAFSCNATSSMATPRPVLFTNESFPHSPGVVTAEYYAMRIRSELNNRDIRMKTLLAPLPFSLFTEAEVGQLNALLVGIFVMVPFAIIPSSFVAFIVKERENHSKDLQLIMGLQFMPYWFTNLVFDFCSFFITNILAIIVFLIFNRNEYVGNGSNFGAVFVLFTLYSLSGTSFAYFLSFFFDSHAVAQNIVMLINFVFGFLFVILTFVLPLLENTADLAEVLRWIFRCFPPYALGEGIVEIAVAEQSRIFDTTIGSSFTVRVAGYNMIYLAVFFPVFYGLTLWLDHPSSNNGRAIFRKVFDYIFCVDNSLKIEPENEEDEEEAEFDISKIGFCLDGEAENNNSNTDSILSSGVLNESVGPTSDDEKTHPENTEPISHPPQHRRRQSSFVAFKQLLQSNNGDTPNNNSDDDDQEMQMSHHHQSQQSQQRRRRLSFVAFKAATDESSNVDERTVSQQQQQHQPDRRRSSFVGFKQLFQSHQSKDDTKTENDDAEDPKQQRHERRRSSFVTFNQLFEQNNTADDVEQISQQHQPERRRSSFVVFKQLFDAIDDAENNINNNNNNISDVQITHQSQQPQRGRRSSTVVFQQLLQSNNDDDSADVEHDEKKLSHHHQSQRRRVSSFVTFKQLIPQPDDHNTQNESFTSSVVDHQMSQSQKQQQYRRRRSIVVIEHPPEEEEEEEEKQKDDKNNNSKTEPTSQRQLHSSQHRRRSSVVKLILEEDEDVVNERERVNKIEIGSEAAKDEVLVVKNLRKVWKTSTKDVVAVDDISFSAPRGSRFFFLGVNGSGKSSTLASLCGQTNPTSGRAWVGGYDVEQEAQEVRRIIGFCPQYDALTDLLTVEEHFKLYCGLRGVDPERIGNVMNKLIDLADLEEHRFKTVESLSGGNKRKLSFALALIGGPDVVFLDEVSAGIDPLARHKLWSLIERVSRECSLIMTTHHLEECEALATRVAIQVKGKFHCIGSLQHLKNKFGTGFELQLRVKHPGDVEACEEALSEKFTQLEWTEIRGTKMAASLPQSTTLSEVFEFLGQQQENLAIEDYTIHQSSIEQVFLRIAAEALARQGDF